MDRLARNPETCVHCGSAARHHGRRGFQRERRWFAVHVPGRGRTRRGTGTRTMLSGVFPCRFHRAFGPESHGTAGMVFPQHRSARREDRRCPDPPGRRSGPEPLTAEVRGRSTTGQVSLRRNARGPRPASRPGGPDRHRLPGQAGSARRRKPATSPPRRPPRPRSRTRASAAGRSRRAP